MTRNESRKRPASLGPGPAAGHFPPRDDHPTEDGRPRSLRKQEARLNARRAMFDAMRPEDRGKNGFNHRPGSSR